MPERRGDIEAFLGRDLASWPGLPPNLEAGDVIPSLRLTQVSGVARRGTARVEYKMWVLAHPSFHSNVTFFFAAGVLAFIETEFWSLDRDECATTLKKVGSPKALMDLYWRESIVPNGLQFHGGNGLALGVIPETGVIVTVTAFPQSSEDQFRERYQNLTLAREFPLPSSS